MPPIPLIPFAPMNMCVCKRKNVSVYDKREQVCVCVVECAVSVSSRNTFSLSNTLINKVIYIFIVCWYPIVST